ncbi:hypothetical protein [Endozoicomonas lisbonensis]|uniref:Uncharacterized protein n=1 Tax=Endozoicomonas lisbonensis TaxID=3120522 RepID=A0ABV2SCT5_9GAMM
MEAKSKVFYGNDMKKVNKDATSFASKMGPQSVINIALSAQEVQVGTRKRMDIRTVVYYWE